MTCKRSVMAAVVAMILASTASGQGIPEIPIRLDFTDQQREFYVRAAAGTTPRVAAYLLNDGVSYTNVAGYTGEFYLAENPTNGWVTPPVVTTNVDTTLGVLYFDFAATNTATNGVLWGQVLVKANVDGIPRVWQWGPGQFELTPSPGSMGAGFIVIDPNAYVRRDGTLDMLGMFDGGLQGQTNVGPWWITPNLVWETNGILYYKDAFYDGPSVDFVNSRYYFDTNIIVLDNLLTLMRDQSGVDSVEWNARELRDATGNVALAWGDPITVHWDVIPNASNTVTLGRADLPFANLYLDESSLYLGTQHVTAARIAAFVPDTDATYTDTVAKAASAVQEGDDPSFNTVTRSSTASVYAAEEFVTFGRTVELIESVSAQTLFGATNDHPSLDGASLWDALPGEVWTNETALAVGTNLLGTWYYTNEVDTLVPAGTFNGWYWASFSGAGGPAVSTFFELIASDGVSTNVLGVSSAQGVNGSIAPVDTHVHMSTGTPFAAGWFLGVKAYGVRDGGASATLTIEGGTADRDTRLSTPNLSVASETLQSIWSYYDGTIQALDDAQPWTTNAVLTFTPNRTGTYQIEVGGVFNAQYWTFPPILYTNYLARNGTAIGIEIDDGGLSWAKWFRDTPPMMEIQATNGTPETFEWLWSIDGLDKTGALYAASITATFVEP